MIHVGLRASADVKMGIKRIQWGGIGRRLVLAKL
jgi:hypothetical protein